MLAAQCLRFGLQIAKARNALGRRLREERLKLAGFEYRFCRVRDR